MNVIKTSYILNSAKPISFLEKALPRLQTIKRSDEEFIVVYAGKEDCTYLRLQHSWVDQWIVELDSGEAHGLNKGIMSSRGQILRFLTDDDIFYETVIHEAIDLCSISQADVVFVAGEHVDENDQRIAIDTGKLEDILAFQNTCGLSICFRKSIIPLVGLLDNRHIAVDLDFITRIIRSKAKIKSINKVGYTRILNSLSNAKRYYAQVQSDKKFAILNNISLFLGDEKIPLQRILEYLNDPKYLHWLGKYITQGLLSLPNYSDLPFVRGYQRAWAFWARWLNLMKKIPGSRRVFHFVSQIVRK